MQSHVTRATRVARIVLLLVMPLSTSAVAAGNAVTPYRPSVSNPAQLPAPGQLELEFGGLSLRDSAQRQDSLPYLLKLAFDPQWGVLLGGQAFVRQTQQDTGARARGVGDTNLILKRAFLIDEATAFGLELGAKIPTARNDIGSGRADYTLNGIASRDFGRLHLDVNLNATHVGLAEVGTGTVQSGASASFSHPLSGQFAATAELSGARRSGTPSTAQLLLALTYSPSKQLTIDLGIVRGLNPASPTLGLFTGLVVPLAQLW